MFINCKHPMGLSHNYFDLLKGSPKNNIIYTIDSSNGGFSIGKIKHHRKQTQAGWWYTYPSEKYAQVSWDDSLFPTVSGKSFKIAWFQSPPTSDKNNH